MTFEYKRQFPKDAKHSGNGNGAGRPTTIRLRIQWRNACRVMCRHHLLRVISDARAPKPARSSRSRVCGCASISVASRRGTSCAPALRSTVRRRRVTVARSIRYLARGHGGLLAVSDLRDATRAGGSDADKLFRCVDCDTETFVHVRAPVVDCPRHGRHEIDLPWTQNGVKWAYLGHEPAENGRRGRERSGQQGKGRQGRRVKFIRRGRARTHALY